MTKSTLELLSARLRAMSPAEILYRLRLEVAEKISARSLGRNEDPTDFCKRLSLGDSKRASGSGPELLQLFRERPVFIWQRDDPEDFRDLFDNDFVAYKQATLFRADQVIAHKLSILGRDITYPGEIGWHYDILGQNDIPVVFWKDLDYYNPEVVAEVKFTWELNRHHHFITLAKAYFLSRDEKYAQELFTQWSSWIEANPYKFGINWTSSLEAALRLIAWTWALQLVKNSGCLTSELLTEILRSVEKHASFISGHLSLYSSANNHLIGEALGLLYAGCYYPMLPGAKKWAHKGEDLLNRELLNQVFQDGVIKEQTTFYQLYIIWFGVLFKSTCEFFGSSLSAELESRLENMANFIYCLLDSGGNVPSMGDEDGGRALQLSEGDDNRHLEAVNVAAVLYQRADFKAVSPNFTEAAYWICGLQAKALFDNMNAEPRRTGVEQFPEGGYIVVRDDKEINRLVFDCGPLGLGALAAHGHADALSVNLSVNGEPILIDSGTYLYLGAGEWRNYFRSTHAHNTATVDDCSQSHMLSPFQWGQRANAGLTRLSRSGNRVQISGYHDGYRSRKVRHNREIELDGPDRLIIRDEMTGRGDHKIDLYFHWIPCQLIERSRHHYNLTFARSVFDLFFESEHDLDIQIFAGNVDPIIGWYSPEFGIKKAHPVLVVTVNGRVPVRIVTRMEITHEISS